MEEADVWFAFCNGICQRVVTAHAARVMGSLTAPFLGRVSSADAVTTCTYMSAHEEGAQVAIASTQINKFWMQ